MDVFNGILQAISQQGFPIVMCVAFAMYITKINQAYRDDVKTLQSSIDKNTATMDRLVEKFEDYIDRRN